GWGGKGWPLARRGGEKGRPQAYHCSTTRAVQPGNLVSLQSLAKRAKAMAHRASEARARRNGEAAMTYREQALSPERNTLARQAGSPTGREAVFPRCSLLPRPPRGLPRASESPRPYNGAKRTAFRDQAGKRPEDRLQPACEQMTLAVRDALPFNSCRAIPLQPLPLGLVRSQTFSATLLAAPTRQKFSCRPCAPTCRCSAPIRKSMPAPPRRVPSPAAAALHPDIPVADARICPRMAWTQRAIGCRRQQASRGLLQRDSPHYPMR